MALKTVTTGLNRWLLAGASLMVGAITVLPAASEPIPYVQLKEQEAAQSVEGAAPASVPVPSLPAMPTTAPATPQAALFLEALRAAKSGDAANALARSAQLTDPIARKVVLWALIDCAATRLDFATVDAARKDMTELPRGWRRTFGAEKTIEIANLPPQKVIDWFGDRDPETPEGALALANAHQTLGQIDEAKELIRHFWREHIFEADLQSRMLARFGVLLTAEDHNARLSTLLYAQQGPAARAMMELVDADHRLLANARIALRAERNDAPDAVALVPQALQDDPGLAFDRARYYRRRNMEGVAASTVHNFPQNVPEKSDVAGFIWTERRALTIALIRSGDSEGAYAAASDTGLKPGPDLAEAEFYAGWIALRKLNNAKAADQHFARLQEVAQSSITVARALYWRGRAAQARGDAEVARQYFTKGAAYYTTFYGLMSAEASGQTKITVGVDPTPSDKDRAAFAARDVIAGAQLLADAGDRDDFRAFLLAAADTSKKTEDYVMLVDMARARGDQDLALRVARAGNYRGYYLPERGYPVRVPPQAPGSAEPSFMLAITRQESSFEPRARSSVGARGLMQLMPATAAGLARRLGKPYSQSSLDDPNYNMELGGVFLGQLLNRFGGSYVLASAAYNAGPGRPATWINTCGDPRQGKVEPTDFIECIPFTETRNYVMRVLENNAIYRARLNGGVAPLTLSADIRKGALTEQPSIDSLLDELPQAGDPAPAAAPGR
jgi:soluble lytic murein transglycosylase